jgi:uncharacterized protein YjbI with pentapeptide repeats
VTRTGGSGTVAVPDSAPAPARSAECGAVTSRPVPRALSDLPYRRHLVPVTEPFDDSTDLDRAHVTGVDLSATDAPASAFSECAFSSVEFGTARLPRSRFTDVRLTGCRLVGTDITTSSWFDAELVNSVVAGGLAYDSTLRRVTFHGCKLASVNLRGSRITDVVFADCTLDEVDFGGATLTRVRFPGSTLRNVGLDDATMDRVDLREADDLHLRLGPSSLTGLVIDTAQLTALAPAFAQALGVTVVD